MWSWSLSGSFASDFLADFVTTSVQFLIELLEGDVLSSLIFGEASGDGAGFRFRRRVDRVAAFIWLSGSMDRDRAPVYGELDHIARFDAGFPRDGPRNAKTL